MLKNMQLGAKLLAIYIIIAALPFSIISYISYTTASDSLRGRIFTELEAIRDLRKEQINTFLTERKNDIVALADNPTFKTVVVDFDNAYRLDGNTIGGPNWKITEARYGTWLSKFKDTFGYYDLILVHSGGKVLYTINKERDLGSDFNDGPFKDSPAARCYRKALKGFAFQDFALYEPSGGAPASFIGMPVQDNGITVGVVLLQIPTQSINAIMQNTVGLGETGETILFGADMLMRSDAIRDPVYHSVDYVFHHPKESVNKAEGARRAIAGETGIRFTNDYKGIPNLVAYTPLNVFGERWGFTTKITEEEALAPLKTIQKLMIVVGLTILLGLILKLLFAQSIANGLKSVVNVADAIAAGKLDTDIVVKGNDEVGKLTGSIKTMQASLRKLAEDNASKDWRKTGQVRLNDVMRDAHEESALCEKIISEITTYLDGKIGAIYLMDERAEEPALAFAAGYAYSRSGKTPARFKVGEGLVGQAAREKKPIVVRDVPADYIKVASGLGETLPRVITLIPFIFEDRVKGVVEIGTLSEITEIQAEYLGLAAESVAINIEAAGRRRALEESLRQAQALTEELQVQQEELRTTNEELEQQTQMLSRSEEMLKSQQEELRVTNEELESKNESLEVQRRDLEQAQRDLEQKAEQVAIASRYKSNFLANMSHELRTPLNSLLLLSRMLMDNKEGNLNSEQVESASVIYNSGNDLLNLINEVLDLSKIEAGRMEMFNENVLTRELADSARKSFQHIAEDKGLNFDVTVLENAPVMIRSDRKRVEQVLRNLISNAIKFTKTGGVGITFFRAGAGTPFARKDLRADNALAVSVKDSGIGIPGEDQKAIFEAFRQADAGTSRKYGGTGLGLSISRELAHMLGGEIHLSSEPGRGSTFTAYFPAEAAQAESEPVQFEPAPHAPRETHAPVPESERVPDDREALSKGENAILVVEDDPSFAKLLCNLCHKKGLKCIIAGSGEEGLKAAEAYRPVGIILDIVLPGQDGWSVLESLKDNPATRHIPVHIMSVEEVSMDALRKGAVGFMTKPVKLEELDAAFRRLEDVFRRAVKLLLVVEDDANQRKAIIKLIGDSDVQVEEARTGREAIRMLGAARYDCMILDLGLPDMTGFDLLETVDSMKNVVMPPVIVYTGKDLTRDEETALRKYADSIIIKGVRSEERLLDETSLFLHRVVGKMPETKRRMIVNLYEADDVFTGKKVLIVDDDMRNSFALSKVLEEKGLKTLKAEDGRKALEILERETGVDLVLMDIMMPIMDGYETMRRIRETPRHENLPIIALTAKAMREDRDKCIAAGANDYLPKPVDVARLCSMLRVWLYR